MISEFEHENNTFPWRHLAARGVVGAGLRLHIPRAKAGQREQPITPELTKVLAREREMRDDSDGWVSPAARPKLSPSGHRTSMGRSFRRAVVAAGLNPAKVTPHVMRRTAITNFGDGGRRLADDPTDQRAQDAADGAALHPRLPAAYQPGDGAISRPLPEPSENENLGTTTPRLHKLRDGAGDERNRRHEFAFHLKAVGLEAGAGIEPTYGDLQSPA